MLEAMGLRIFEPVVAASLQPDEELHSGSQTSRLTTMQSAPASSAAAAAKLARAEPRGLVVSAPSNPGSSPVAQMDWQTLESTVAACRACGLCETRKQTVFGVGHPQAHWMIVGEAPGEQEDVQGQPFVGASGKLLDAMLHTLGLTRQPAPAQQQVYIANTIKCRPPRNRNPSGEELKQCEPFLSRQIALVSPRVIVAMGRFAVQSLLRSDEAIGRLRGRVHNFEGRPLVVTYHPAYLLRNPIDKARAWEDLCLAADVAQKA